MRLSIYVNTNTPFSTPEIYIHPKMIHVWLPTDAFKRLFFLKGIDYDQVGTGTGGIYNIPNITSYKEFLVTYNILRLTYKGEWETSIDDTIEVFLDRCTEKEFLENAEQRINGTSD